MSKERIMEIFRFCIVGGLSFLLDFALLYICTEYIGINYFYSAAIAFTISVIFNYWLCIVFVFDFAGTQTKKQATLFIGSSIAGLGINQICMWIFVEKFGIWYMIAKVLATIIVTFWNYVVKRKALQA